MCSFPEQAKSLKDEGNAYFKEKNYQKAVVAYTVGLKKKCADQDLNAVLLTNRAASHFYLGKKKKHPNVLLLSQKMTLFKKDMSGFFFFP